MPEYKLRPRAQLELSTATSKAPESQPANQNQKMQRNCNATFLLNAGGETNALV
jgi:hypothetical protein